MQVIDGIETVEVKAFEDLYFISKCGKLYRKYKYKYKQVHGSQTPRGYIYVHLSNKKKGQEHRRTTLLHRVVAEAYIPNPNNYGSIDHIDENKINNDVSNLRWCTIEQNINFAKTKDGRDRHSALRKRHAYKLERLLGKIRLELANTVVIENRAQKAYTELLEDKAKFEQHVKDEENRIKLLDEGYQGYKHIAGTKFKSLQDLVNKTGKPIVVNGKKFISCGAAASYIIDNVVDRPLAKKSAISKELRKYLQGKRGSWHLYNQFTIGY